MYVDKKGVIQSSSWADEVDLKRLQASVDAGRRERENRLKLEESMRRKKEIAQQKKAYYERRRQLEREAALGIKVIRGGKA